MIETRLTPRRRRFFFRFDAGRSINLVIASYFCCLLGLSCSGPAIGQSTIPNTTEQKVEKLTEAVAQAQKQMEAYQQQMTDLQQQLVALRRELAAENSAPTSSPTNSPGNAAALPAPSTAATLTEIQERQAITESQIATHEETKVETASKYPLAISGMILFDGFVNTRQVDIPASPAYAITGSGSTGFSVRQTILGFDARGPHLLGALSRGDLHADFFASAAQSNYAATGILRLRTAHAMLDWKNTEAFFQLDRSILEPNEPSSLVAVAQPELSWSGNLWTWNPQVGIKQQISITDSTRLQVQAAFIDTADQGLPSSTSSSTVTQTERSRWPGSETRIGLERGPHDSATRFGVGGYFSPHETGSSYRYNAWAATADLNMPLSKLMEVTANAYRGQALEGLGAGGYVNYVYRYKGDTEVATALDDVGGWTQLKVKASPRLSFNTGYGIDNPFAKEIRSAIGNDNDPSKAASYQGLIKNRSVFSNVIYSPSSYLVFSLEYRRLWSNYLTSPLATSDGIGIGAGYRF